MSSTRVRSARSVNSSPGRGGRGDGGLHADTPAWEAGRPAEPSPEMTSNAFGRVARFGVGLLAVAVFMVSGPSGAPVVSANHLPLPDSAPDNSTFTFSRQAPSVDSFAPTGTGVSVNAGITISFTQPMSRASVERTFSIRPRVDGRLVWLDDFTLGFQPDLLAYSAIYEVEVHVHSSG